MGADMGLGFLGSIFVGGLAGWIASMIMKADTGILANIILGIVGAIVANFLLGVVGISASGWWVSQLVVGLLGACILIGVGRAVRN